MHLILHVDLKSPQLGALKGFGASGDVAMALDGADSSELLLRATSTVRRIEDEAEASELTWQSRRQLVARLLRGAIEAAEGGAEERLEELERAVEGARKMGIHPELRAAWRVVKCLWGGEEGKDCGG